jgi:hypothetical protein
MKKIARAGILSLTFVLAFMIIAALTEVAVAGRYVPPTDKSHVRMQSIQIQAKHEAKEDREYIHLNKHDLTLTKGKSETLKASLMPSGKSVSVKWKSSNPKIATVSSSGKVTAVAPGIAVIQIWNDEYHMDFDHTGYSDECYVTVQGGATDTKPLGTSDRTYFYSNTKLTASTSKLKDALAKVKKSIGGNSYSKGFQSKDIEETYEGLIYGYFWDSWEGLLFGSKDASKAHTEIYVQAYEEGGQYCKYGFVAWNNKSPIKTNRGIIIGSKKSSVQQKYGLPTYTYQYSYNGNTYETFSYESKATGKALYTNLTFHFIKSNETVSTIAFFLGRDTANFN